MFVSATALAAVRRGAVAEQRLQELEALARQVESHGPAGMARQRRDFGRVEAHGPGEAVRQQHRGPPGEADRGWLAHEVTYLHQRAAGALLAALWELAVAADAAMPAWGVLGRLGPSQRPALRCLEAISYFPDRAGGEKDYHHDGATLLTVVVSLTSTGVDFDGGELEVRVPGGLVHRVSEIRRGDVIAWRGWDEHRVSPVLRGERRVIVAEWWLGPSCKGDRARPRDTLAIFREALALDASSAVLHREVANQLRASQNYTGAIESYLEALRIDPQHAIAQFNFGMVLRTTGDFAGAEASFRNAIQINPRLAPAHSNLGTVLHQRGDVAGAERSYYNAIEADPSFAEPHNHLGAILNRRGDLKGAERRARLALKLDPQFFHGHELLGQIHGTRRDFEAAERSFRAAIQLSPLRGNAHANLGVILVQRGDLVSAEKSFQAALRLNPADTRSRQAVIDVRAKIRRSRR